MDNFFAVIFIGIVVYAIFRRLLSRTPSVQLTQEVKKIEKELERHKESERAIEEARERAKELEKSLKKRKVIVSQEEISVEAPPPVVPTKEPKEKVSPRDTIKMEKFNVNKKETPKESLLKYPGRDPIVKCYKFTDAVVLLTNPQGLNTLISLANAALTKRGVQKIMVTEADSVPYWFGIEVKKETGIEVEPAYEEWEPVKLEGSETEIKELLNVLNKVFQKNKTHKGFFTTRSGYDYEIQVMCINEGVGGEIWEKFPCHYEADFEDCPDQRKSILKNYMI